MRDSKLWLCALALSLRSMAPLDVEPGGCPVELVLRKLSRAIGQEKEPGWLRRGTFTVNQAIVG